MLYIFQNQRLTMPVQSPSLFAITLPLHSPATLSLTLCDHASSVSPTLHQSPSPFSISRRCRYPGALPVPFSNSHRTHCHWLQVRCSTVLLFCAAFVLWEMDVYQRGISHYQNLQFFSFVLWVRHRFRFCVGKKRW